MASSLATTVARTRASTAAICSWCKRFVSSIFCGRTASGPRHTSPNPPPQLHGTPACAPAPSWHRRGAPAAPGTPCVPRRSLSRPGTPAPRAGDAPPPPCLASHALHPAPVCGTRQALTPRLTALFSRIYDTTGARLTPLVRTHPCTRPHLPLQVEVLLGCLRQSPPQPLDLLVGPPRAPLGLLLGSGGGGQQSLEAAHLREAGIRRWGSRCGTSRASCTWPRSGCQGWRLTSPMRSSMRFWCARATDRVSCSIWSACSRSSLRHSRGDLEGTQLGAGGAMLAPLETLAKMAWEAQALWSPHRSATASISRRCCWASCSRSSSSFSASARLARSATACRHASCWTSHSWGDAKREDMSYCKGWTHTQTGRAAGCALTRRQSWSQQRPHQPRATPRPPSPAPAPRGPAAPVPPPRVAPPPKHPAPAARARPRPPGTPPPPPPPGPSRPAAPPRPPPRVRRTPPAAASAAPRPLPQPPPAPPAPAPPPPPAPAPRPPPPSRPSPAAASGTRPCAPPPAAPSPARAPPAWPAPPAAPRPGGVPPGAAPRAPGRAPWPP